MAVFVLELALQLGHALPCLTRAGPLRKGFRCVNMAPREGHTGVLAKSSNNHGLLRIKGFK